MSLTTTEHSAAHPTNIVSHIRDLLPLPRHAVFHVKLVVHQLTNVPLMSGQFRIKWRFRNLQAVNSAGRPLGLGRTIVRKLDKRMGRDVARPPRNHNNNSSEEQQEGESESSTPYEGAATPQSTSTGRPESAPPIGQIPNGSARPLGLGRVLAHKLGGRQGELKTLTDKGKGKEVADTEPELESPSPVDVSPISQRPASSHSSSPSSNSKQSSSTGRTPPSESQGIDYRPDPRGYTPYLPLQDFKIEFAHQIDVAVQMSIDKESLALLPSELKLTVMQRVISGDPDAPLNPRLGHVTVNLAEYADAGSVTRNYLLRRSKVNAMVNMTITMTQISGEDNYRAPPLRKEEIGAGIAEFLSLTEPLPALSRFLPTEDPWLDNSPDFLLPQIEDLDPVPAPPDPPPVEAPVKRRWGPKRRKADTLPPQPPPPPPPVKKQQLHPTEALIEAIFNPYPTTSTAPSPFTYYVPPAPPAQASDSAEGTSYGSFEESEVGHGAEGGEGNGGVEGGGAKGGKWWRRKTGVGTPARSNSTRS